LGADGLIARVAARHHGVVTRRQLAEVGVTNDQVKHRLATDRLIAVHRGVYAVGHEALSPLGRVQAALFAAGPNAAASHATAAFLHRLTLTLPDPVEVSITTGQRRNRPGLLIHRAPTLETVMRHGLRVTTPRRTVQDLGWPDELVREALAKHLIRPHHVPAKRDFAPTQSVLEERMLRLCRIADLPEPICQYRIGRHRVDFAWPAQRFVVETDGFDTHGGRRQPFEDDRARDAYVIARGWVVMHVTWLQLSREPYAVAARLAAALALREASTPVAP
jgi:very-short-patch-repair endonuclease